MLNFLPVYMIRSLLFTIIIEVTAGCFIGIRSGRDVIIVLLVNLLTNPLLVVSTFLIGFFWGSSVRYVSVLVLEVVVLVVEGTIYSKMISNRKINPFLLSILLNASSYGLGIIINRLF